MSLYEILEIRCDTMVFNQTIRQSTHGVACSFMSPAAP